MDGCNWCMEGDIAGNCWLPYEKFNKNTALEDKICKPFDGGSIGQFEYVGDSPPFSVGVSGPVTTPSDLQIFNMSGGISPAFDGYGGNPTMSRFAADGVTPGGIIVLVGVAVAIGGCCFACSKCGKSGSKTSNA